MFDDLKTQAGLKHARLVITISNLERLLDWDPNIKISPWRANSSGETSSAWSPTSLLHYWVPNKSETNFSPVRVGVRRQESPVFSRRIPWADGHVAVRFWVARAHIFLLISLFFFPLVLPSYGATIPAITACMRSVMQISIRTYPTDKQVILINFKICSKDKSFYLI